MNHTAESQSHCKDNQGFQNRFNKKKTTQEHVKYLRKPSMSENNQMV